MGKETEIWLGEEEIDSLLQGSMLWTDVASRLTLPTNPPRIRRLGEPLAKFHGAQSVPVEEDPLRPEVCLPGITPARKEEAVQIEVWQAERVTWVLVAVAVLTVGSWFYFALMG